MKTFLELVCIISFALIVTAKKCKDLDTDPNEQNFDAIVSLIDSLKDDPTISFEFKKFI